MKVAFEEDVFPLTERFNRCTLNDASAYLCGGLNYMKAKESPVG
jgi:hypothetical protein